MSSYRPTGVTILAVFIIFFYSIVFIAGLLVFLFGLSIIPQIGVLGVLVGVAGMAVLIYALLRLSVGFGLLSLKSKAWKSAMIIFGLGLIIDLIFSPEQVVLDVIVLVYLLIVKKHFVY